MRTTPAFLAAPRRIGGASLAALVVGATLAGCGSTPMQQPSIPTSSPPSTAAPTPTPVATPTSVPTRKPSHAPTKPQTGNGDAEGDDEPAAAGGGVCVDLSETEIATVLGGAVTGSALPGGGCSFDQSKPSRPAASIVETAFSDLPDGMDGAKTNATSAVEGDPVDVAGIGDEAFWVTGTEFGGPYVQGAGAVRVGNRLVSVNVSQSVGLTAPKVRALVLSLLRLAAGKLG